jgi:hypothetical protein
MNGKLTVQYAALALAVFAFAACSLGGDIDAWRAKAAGKEDGGGTVIHYSVSPDNATNTTALNFLFSSSVGLNYSSIYVSSVSGSLTKGTPTGSGTSWTLPVTVSTAGTVLVSITKSGIESGTKTVTVHGVMVVSGSNLAAKLSWLNSNAASNTDYLLEVNADEAIVPHTLEYSGKSNITITLKGAGSNRLVSLSALGSMFTVGSGVTLVLDSNLILQGRSNNNDNVITVGYGGKLIMNTGTSITGNTNADYGGVWVYGTFTMNGGTISGNSATVGGGVAIFYYSGGFRMSGGTIYGSSASSTLRNTASIDGAGLFDETGTAEYGVYSGETFYTLGYLTTTNNTLRVQNGTLYNN